MEVREQTLELLTCQVACHRDLVKRSPLELRPLLSEAFVHAIERSRVVGKKAGDVIDAYQPVEARFESLVFAEEFRQSTHDALVQVLRL